jgi:hypothetical protein
MEYLEIAAILIGIISAAIGFSLTLYLLTLYITDRGFLNALEAYRILIMKQVVEDKKAVPELLRIARGNLGKYESDLPEIGLMRRYKETVKLVLKLGEVEQRKNFLAIHPIYGYNEKGEETLVADSRDFYQLSRDAIASRQQKAAFLMLMIAFLVQLLAVFVHI